MERERGVRIEGSKRVRDIMNGTQHVYLLNLMSHPTTFQFIDFFYFVVIKSIIMVHSQIGPLKMFKTTTNEKCIPLNIIEISQNTSGIK
jgi:hypothetical protein